MISQSHALLAWLWGLELDEWDGSLSLDPISNLIKSLGASLAAAAAKSLQSCLTLCDPIDGSPPGSPVPGILQARTLEWVAISFSNAWKWKVKVKMLSRVQLLATPWTAAYQAPPSMGFSRQEYSPVVEISPSKAGGAGSILGQSAKIPYALWPKSQNIKQKQYCNKFNKDFKNGPHQKKKETNKQKSM